MLRIMDGGSRIGFYFILALLAALLTARIFSGLMEFVKNRKLPVMKDTAVVLDREALRLIGQMPAWKPALFNGKPQAVKMTLPIRFKL